MRNNIINGDCTIEICKFADESIDVVCTDPPYLYLNHKLDREFDEDLLFSEFMRILKPDGFIIIFGRGESFYRWNYKLSQLGFNFKEEVIWNKRHSTSPMLPLNRVHETVSIWSKGGGVLNSIRIPYLEQKKYDLYAISNDIKRLLPVLNNNKSLNDIKDYIENQICRTKQSHQSGFEITMGSRCYDIPRDILTMKGIQEGLKEKSIMEINREHYAAQHPTQKPVRLLERLLNLVVKDGDTILDPFMGSGSTGVAAQNLKLNFIGIEIDNEYFEVAKSNLKKPTEQKLEF